MSLSTKRDVRFIGAMMGRYTLASRARRAAVQVFGLRLQSISADRLVALAPVIGDLGETAAAFFPAFGNVRGTITRHIEGGFCVDINVDDEQRERLAARIEWQKKHVVLGVTDKREHVRFMPRSPRSVLVLADGTTLPCLVIDVSSSGAAISADIDPELGAPLAVGQVVARVVRKLEVGFAVQFVNAIERGTLEEKLRPPKE